MIMFLNPDLHVTLLIVFYIYPVYVCSWLIVRFGAVLSRTVVGGNITTTCVEFMFRVIVRSVMRLIINRNPKITQMLENILTQCFDLKN